MGRLENSQKKKYMAGKIRSPAVTVRITLLCILYFRKWNLFFLISAQVTNPSPPVMIKAIIVKFTIGFDA